MSWKEYIDGQYLLGSGVIAKAAILGLQGGVWASSPGYTISPAEQKAVVELFNNPDNAPINGVRLQGQKFFVLQANKRSIYGKKQADGCVLVKTKQAVLVAEYIAPNQAQEATPPVEKLADYLISIEY
ncbi:profilin [Hygrophoropsis aurantiaca]|uniref:Profilin n=1 Tax=Hygrophoropsis aurantiaca TaxID=72124 RepID=A0ACB8APP0_9AGAM|nr:profilin [Hygrophoropsis aurantiaca]